MKALLIDAHNKIVTEVEHTGGLDDIYKHTRCDTITAVSPFDSEDTVYVDDEGLLVPDLAAQPFFMIDGWPEPLAGNGLVLGIDEEGESVSPYITLADLTPKVRFLSYTDVCREMSQ